MPEIKTAEDFKAYVADIEGHEGYRKPIGFGICRLMRGQKDESKILSCEFPVVNWEENYGSAAIFWDAIGADTTDDESVFPISKDFCEKALAAFAPFIEDAKGDTHRNVQLVKALAAQLDKGAKGEDYSLVFLFADSAPQSVPAIYLKLHALSAGKADLRSLNLDGVFGKLENVAWSGNKVYELDYLRENEIELKLAGEFPAIDYVDKFPRYLMHVIPSNGTRVLDTSKVRFGAQLADGTTVMPGASYINFNAGTLGPVMVEGRVSSSAVVGAGSDVGGGASILGVLSGGNATPISVGEKCLLGVNSVTGIPIGDGCILDAGVTVLPGTRIFVAEKEMEELKAVNPDKDFKDLSIYYHEELGMYEFKGAAFQFCNGIHFRVNSDNGRMIAKRSTREIELNKDLHQSAA